MRKAGMKRMRWGLAAVSAMIAAGACHFWLGPVLFPRPDLVVAPEPGCDLQRSACVTEVAPGAVEVRFEPRPIPSARPFRARVMAKGLSVRKVEIDFSGTTMDMGFNRTVLAVAGDGSHAAEVVLPACISGPMEWRATFVLHGGDRRIVISHVFQSGE
ncbi:hypothetical protein C666_04995 [Thauera linaloolentis 47Lol = DSM 12138]|uniref:Lipoprotein n=2 Tax=Thauera linaloolentis TaxID=76112 RepID=N6Y5Z6_THAL4|nr:hypothetical protein C666_04995 [Thauera linaloolentis 47Lol = DSM 12138]